MTLGQMKRDWTPSAGPDRYRRGLYTFFWRATPHPSLIVFDAPDATQACTRRIRSNTPLQALTLLNDEAFVEFAQALAARLLARRPATPSASASPSASAWAASRARRSVGRSQGCSSGSVPRRRSPPEEPGRCCRRRRSGRRGRRWRACCLNLDEFITRE